MILKSDYNTYIPFGFPGRTNKEGMIISDKNDNKLLPNEVMDGHCYFNLPGYNAFSLYRI